LDDIIDTVPAVHPLLPLIGLLKSHGKLVIVGGPEKPLELPVFPLLMGKHMQNNITYFIKSTLVIEPMFSVTMNISELRRL
jgi:D-arabinose 1-dehydrogenase-like Zn-dependent alcohol dehydrogenase